MATSNETMQAVTKRSVEVNDVALALHPRPVARPGHVVVQVAAVGICGTDLHIMRNEYISNPPVILGHEVCGHVVDLGQGTDPALRGRRVVAETFFATCGACRYCREGRPNMCGSRKSIGTHVNGAMAPLVEVPVHALHAAPEGLSDAAASLAEPVACVANSLFGEVSFIEPGDRVLVTGPGAIGQLAAQVARAAGGRVTLRGTARDAARLAMADDLGFQTSVVGDDLPEASFDKCVECSGAGQAFAEGLGFLVKGGHLMNMGLSGRSTTLMLDPICLKELRITSGFASTPRSWRRAMAWLNAGVLTLEPLVSAVLPLGGWQTGFDRSFAADGIKFVLDPRL